MKTKALSLAAAHGIAPCEAPDAGRGPRLSAANAARLDRLSRGENEEIMPECEADRFFLLRTMLCSLGRRGRWNFAPGIGPRLDGTVPPRLRPQLDAIRDFLAWAGEAVYGTRGPAGTFLRAGWTELRGVRAFYAATVRLDDLPTCSKSTSRRVAKSNNGGRGGRRD